MEPVTGTLNANDPSLTQPVYEAEKIVDIRDEDDESRTFKVRWVGCDSTADQWIPAENINDHRMVMRFENERGIPRQIEEVPDAVKLLDSVPSEPDPTKHCSPSCEEEVHATGIDISNKEPKQTRYKTRQHNK